MLLSSVTFRFIAWIIFKSTDFLISFSIKDLIIDHIYVLLFTKKKQKKLLIKNYFTLYCEVMQSKISKKISHLNNYLHIPMKKLGPNERDN